MDKGDKELSSNYRPISNLSNISKAYEKCILDKLDEEVSNVGNNQHGFRKHYSTETALLTLQSIMAEKLENKIPTILYSVDLSAAFDLLRPDNFKKMFENVLSEGLLFAVCDFLVNRTFQVQYGQKTSSKIYLDRGCVQGSVLGPKLFNIYLRDLENIIGNDDVQVVTYADDTCVLVSGKDHNEVISNTNTTINKHVDYLKSLGMVVNVDKTEVMWLGTNRPNGLDSIIMSNHIIKLRESIKALGVTFTSNLDWSNHIKNVINKGKSLMVGFKYLRRYLTEDQFLKTVANSFYSTVCLHLV